MKPKDPCIGCLVQPMCSKTCKHKYHYKIATEVYDRKIKARKDVWFDIIGFTVIGVVALIVLIATASMGAR